MRVVSESRDVVMTAGGGGAAGMESDRVINASILHGGAEQKYWLERRSFRRSPRAETLMPTWERFANVLVALSRPVPRVVPEASFRLMAMFLKLTFLGRLTELTTVMLPHWHGLRFEGLVAEAKKAAAASPVTPATDVAPKTTPPATNSESPPTP